LQTYPSGDKRKDDLEKFFNFLRVYGDGKECSKIAGPVLW